jgi:hypothetical protein
VDGSYIATAVPIDENGCFTRFFGNDALDADGEP